MAAYSGKSKRIKNALVTLMSGVQYDAGSGNEPAFVSVLDNTQGEFTGYPSLRVLPNDVTNEKYSTHQSDRTVAFVARVHIPLEETPESEAAAFDKVYDLTDLIIDAIDVADSDGTLNTLDATLGVLLMDADRGDWTVQVGQSGVMLLCDVNVTVRYSKNT